MGLKEGSEREFSRQTHRKKNAGMTGVFLARSLEKRMLKASGQPLEVLVLAFSIRNFTCAMPCRYGLSAERTLRINHGCIRRNVFMRGGAYGAWIRQGASCLDTSMNLRS